MPWKEGNSELKYNISPLTSITRRDIIGKFVVGVYPGVPVGTVRVEVLMFEYTDIAPVNNLTLRIFQRIEKEVWEERRRERHT